MKTNTPEKFFINQLYAHKCQLPPSDDYQYLRHLKKTENCFLISERSLESYLKAKSLSGIYYEKRRQVRTTKVVIHPFSKFRKIWMIWMTFVLLLSYIFFPFFAAFHGPVYAKQLFHLNHHFHFFWFFLYAVVAIQLAGFLDIIVNFFTGYTTVSPEEMVIQPRRIFRRYLMSYFVFDFASSLPVDFILVSILGLKKYSELGNMHVLVVTILPFCRFFRLYTFYKYSGVLFSIFSSSEVSYLILYMTVVFFLLIHWSTCITVLISRFINHDNLFKDIVFTQYESWIFSAKLYKRDIISMYVCATYRSLTCITRLGIDFFITSKMEDKIVSGVLGILGSLYLLLLLVVFLQATSAVARAKISYAEIMSQVNHYMEFKKFPRDLKKKVTEYYICLYQKHYVDENAVLKLASETLQKEILLRKYQRLIENVNILSGLNQNLTIQILRKLKPVIYREGEVIFKYGDYPECMYFVSFGTFAFYNKEGTEVGHMDDGNYFGDLSVLFNSGRYATSVAVETSLVYRFESNDFDEIIRPEKTLVNKMVRNAEAWNRKHEHQLSIQEKMEKGARKGFFGDHPEEEEDLDDED